MTFRRATGWVVVGLVVTLASAEALVRVSGLLEFPLFAVDDEIGYIPRPHQHGCFLIERCWVFNDRSMATATDWNPALHSNILLIGNSIVMGGGHFDQRERIAALLQDRLGPIYSVWPIAANGWTNVNEAVYLERHPEVLQNTQTFVWEFMTGGLSQPTPWAGEYVWPSKRPKWASWYALRRFVLPRFIDFNTSELPPQGAIRPLYLAGFEAKLAEISRATARSNPGIILLYPNRAQLLTAHEGKEWLPERQELERLSGQYELTLLDLAKRPEWKESLYREDIHPTVEGNRVLAALLSAAIKDSLR